MLARSVGIARLEPSDSLAAERALAFVRTVDDLLA